MSNDAKSNNASSRDESLEDHVSTASTAPSSPITATSLVNTKEGDDLYQYLDLSRAGSYSPSSPWIAGTSAAVTNNVNATSSDAIWNFPVYDRNLACPPGFEWNELPCVQDNTTKAPSPSVTQVDLDKPLVRQEDWVSGPPPYVHDPPVYTHTDPNAAPIEDAFARYTPEQINELLAALEYFNNLDNAIDPTLLVNKVSNTGSNDHDCPPDYVVVSEHNLQTLSSINNDDLNCVVHDDASSEEVMLAQDSDDDDDSVEVDDIQRHFWVAGDIKYVFTHNKQRFCLTAEAMDERFEGVRSALWLYWQRKKRSRIPLRKLLQHLRFKGHTGFFREMLWHLLPPAEHRRLINLRRKGNLHLWRG